LSGEGKKSQEYWMYFKIYMGPPAKRLRWGEEEETALTIFPKPAAARYFPLVFSLPVLYDTGLENGV